MRLAVCMPQVPFERGGTEIFADGLVQALREHGHETELVTVPYKWYPGERCSRRRSSGGCSTSRRRTAGRSTR